MSFGECRSLLAKAIQRPQEPDPQLERKNLVRDEENKPKSDYRPFELLAFHLAATATASVHWFLLQFDTLQGLGSKCLATRGPADPFPWRQREDCHPGRE